MVKPASIRDRPMIDGIHVFVYPNPFQRSSILFVNSDPSSVTTSVTVTMLIHHVDSLTSVGWPMMSPIPFFDVDPGDADPNELGSCGLAAAP